MTTEDPLKNHTHPRCELRTIVISALARESAYRHDVLNALRRHTGGDWARCMRRNNRTLSEDPAGERVSLYRDRYDRAFFMVTNATHDGTCVALRHELSCRTDG